ncbi:hypothetical protein LPJ78_001181 [Coemansia sp. RSA 989]|nr:peroxisome membrane protein [Coemansia mojavensis]KAJ1743820.1 hypothetical protein LPJ68_000627 [Coemansia sp. RSA 1086]KAJ1867235.1 hypothetical protein LPJ78_001181 [Coemansia sp. RSA 989]KAJ1876030.1 hypothetical protein LPJ55_000210 [Coemansia sp. RSA 990]KAJ2674066.1 hypothetical protein IWW42_001886 [Coemansia sp. RSA 1085]
MVLQKYARFVVSNAAQVNSIENGLRTLTYILPGRFADAELASEAIYTLLNFVGIYHDSLLSKAANSGLLVDKEGQPLKIDVSPFNRYHGSLSRNLKLYRVLSLVLSSLQFSEKLVEMVVAKKFSDKLRWRVVSWIEILKCVLRLNLLHLSSRRMVTGTVIPERLVDPASLGTPNLALQTAAKKGDLWTGERSKLNFTSVRDILQKTEGNADLGSFITSEVRDAEAIAPAQSLIRPFRALGLAGELLFILRPIIYVLGIRKLGKRDWRPWALSLLIELVSRQMVRTDLHAGKDTEEHTLEREELSRRKWLFLYYLLRSPFYDQFTESRLSGIAEWCNRKPLLSLLGSLIQDYQPLWQQYYFYTAGS